VIHAGHTNLACHFATLGADKFRDAGFLANDHGPPELPGLSAVLDCAVHAKVDGSDHTILLGRVECTRLEEPPAVYFRRTFYQLTGANEID
jgi:flavin reductase ActVB